MPEVTYHRYEGERAAAAELDTFLHVYEEVYSEPPYSQGPREVSEFIDIYRVHVQRPGMRLVLAREGDELVGFTYGFRLPPETRWWRSVQQPLPDDFTREDGTRTWVTIELAVRKPWRRQGIAAELHTRLLASQSIERATLTMRPEPEAAPAHAAYASWGYRKVGVAHPWESAPYYHAMVCEITPSTT